MNLTMKVKKLVPEATLPTQAKLGDAGYDLVAIDDGEHKGGEPFIQYRTGLSVELPPGYHIELFPRSSISKYDLVLANSIGLVDNGYRGELLIRFKHIPARSDPWGNFVSPVKYKKGDKIAQMVIRRTISVQIDEVSELSDTERGTGGFGSTDKVSEIEKRAIESGIGEVVIN